MKQQVDEHRDRKPDRQRKVWSWERTPLHLLQQVDIQLIVEVRLLVEVRRLVETRLLLQMRFLVEMRVEV